MGVILLDKNFDVCSMPIDDYRSFIWQSNWAKCGNFSLFLKHDYFQAVKNARYVYQSEEGETAVIEIIDYSGEGSKTNFYVKGRDINALMYDCVVSRPFTLRGNLETEIRRLVQQIAIKDPTQKIQKLQLGALNGYTESIDMQITGAELGSALYSILNPYGMSWKLRHDFENDCLVFQILKGTDRTQAQIKNAWAVFST